MDTAQLLVTILGAGGGGAAILALINGTFKWITGSAGRERQRNTDLVSQRLKAVEERDSAEKERDESDKKRREAYEYASKLRRQLIEHGIEPIPPFELEDPGLVGVPRPIPTEDVTEPPASDDPPKRKKSGSDLPTHPTSPYS